MEESSFSIQESLKNLHFEILKKLTGRLQSASWLQNSSFWIQNSSFLIQNSSFITQNSSFSLTLIVPLPPPKHTHITGIERLLFAFWSSVISLTRVATCKFHHLKYKVPRFWYKTSGFWYKFHHFYSHYGQMYRDETKPGRPKIIIFQSVCFSFSIEESSLIH